jgi:SPP1 gp7 family putative phage head morphogenesis protein
MQYVEGFFIGDLNASLSKELRGIGAVYNKVKKAYKLEISNLPQTILMAASEGNMIAKGKLKKVEDFLHAIEGRKLTAPELEPFFGDTLTGLNKQFQSTTQKVTGKDLEIPLNPRFSDAMKEAYTQNLELYINKWHDEAVLRLRRKVAKNVEQGFRAENLIETIQSEKKVSYNKAKFLAKQETSLMVSKYRQIRYEDIGIKKYMWSTSRDVRVRHDHAELQGKIFRFDQPPVTDHSTMARNNPGEDYGCRCVAIPVLSTYNMLEIEHANK